MEDQKWITREAQKQFADVSGEGGGPTQSRQAAWFLVTLHGSVMRNFSFFIGITTGFHQDKGAAPVLYDYTRFGNHVHDSVIFTSDLLYMTPDCVIIRGFKS